MASKQGADRLDPTQALKHLILERGLRPGDPLPSEAELVETLEISRPTLREAIRTLVALDILAVQHGRGTFVGPMSLRPLVEGLVFKGVLMPGAEFKALHEVIELRKALDLALVDQVVAALADGDVTDLQKEVACMIAAAEDNQPFTTCDRRFHQIIAARVGNELYTQLVAAFWDIHQAIAPRLGIISQRDRHASALAHSALLEAAVAGDVAAYRAAVDAHYDPLIRSLAASA